MSLELQPWHKMIVCPCCSMKEQTDAYTDKRDDMYLQRNPSLSKYEYNLGEVRQHPREDFPYRKSSKNRKRPRSGQRQRRDPLTMEYSSMWEIDTIIGGPHVGEESRNAREIMSG